MRITTLVVVENPGRGCGSAPRAAEDHRCDLRRCMSTGCGGKIVHVNSGVSSPRGPVATLRRIAFLLERGRQEAYKVKAFRTAAASLLALSDDEVAARV